MYPGADIKLPVAEVGDLSVNEKYEVTPKVR